MSDTNDKPLVNSQPFPNVFNPPPGIKFYDARMNKWMKYVYPSTQHWTAGWILVQHPDGGWYTYRKATEADIAALNRAVAAAHHEAKD